MDTLIFAKVVILLASILFFVPLCFLLLVGSIGRFFSLTIERDSWVATTKNRLIKAVFQKFLVR